MSSSALILAYVTVLLAGLAALALYSERRRRRFEPEPSHDHIFRCGQCHSVYTDDADVDRSRCPQCGRMNEAIVF
jgi:rRNA maturation endonuclease Nob1